MMVRAVLVGAAVLLFAFSAFAADFIVNSTVDAVDAAPGDGICAAADGSCTLRAAVIEANGLPGPDSIFVPSGTYVLTIGGVPEDQSLAGDLDVLDDISIVGAGAASTIVDAAGANAGFTLGAPSATISGLLMTGATQSGLVVLQRSQSLGVTVTDCIIEHNAGFGIDAGVLSGIPRPVFSIIRTSVRDNGGVGVSLAQQAISGGPNFRTVIEDSQISRNAAGFSSKFSNVAIRRTVVEENLNSGIQFEDTVLAVEDSLIRGNRRAGIGEGNDARLSVVRTTIEENGAGGVSSSGDSSHLLIVDSAIVRNSGAAAVTSNSIVEIRNSTISENSGPVVGGIEYRYSRSYGVGLRVLSSTLAGNTGGSIGGIGVLCQGCEYPISLGPISGSIIAGNRSGSGPSDCGQISPAVDVSIEFNGGNLVGNTSDCNFTSASTDQIGTSTNPIDPLLGPLANNGGPTPTHALMPGSPALDASPDSCMLSDQRGYARPYDGDGDGVAVCDIGAYESAPVDADFDGDMVGDLVDNCRHDANAEQADVDQDGVGDACDNCGSISNAFQEDRDSDIVGDICDNCLTVANARVPDAWLASNPWAVLTGGQRDDDADGYGNQCDAKFPGTPGSNVGSDDLTQFRASNGKPRSAMTCGTSGILPCAIFDLDESSLLIGTPDLSRFRQLNGTPPGPTCLTCPLACEAGASRSCAP